MAAAADWWFMRNIGKGRFGAPRGELLWGSRVQVLVAHPRGENEEAADLGVAAVRGDRCIVRLKRARGWVYRYSRWAGGAAPFPVRAAGGDVSPRERGDRQPRRGDEGGSGVLQPQRSAARGDVPVPASGGGNHRQVRNEHRGQGGRGGAAAGRQGA